MFMNNVINKIIEKLEKKIFKAELHDFGWEGQTVDNLLCLGDVAEITQEVAEEHNNGWILCSERMLEEYESVFAKHKSTDFWKPFMFEKASDLVNVTVTNKKGEAVTGYMHTKDGEWSGLDYDNIVTAWQPLPSPYKEKTN